jgi:hypothetical protein
MLQDFTIEATHDFKVGLLAEEFIGAFKEAYGISGIPTYLLLVQGQERGRVLGFIDLKALKGWLGELGILS